MQKQQLNAIVAAVAAAVNAKANAKIEAAVVAHVANPGTLKAFKTLAGITSKKLTKAVLETCLQAKPVNARRKFASEWRGFVNAMIAEGQYTRKQIMGAALAEFEALKESAVGTYLCDCKNEKYYVKSCGLDKLAVLDKETKVLSFAK